MKTQNEKWRTLNGKQFNQPIKQVIEDTIICEKANGYQLKICVGTDSQVYQDVVEYATVVVVLRIGKGGFMFIRNEKEKNNRGIKERMLNEVTKSIEVAYSICDLLDAYGVELEVHADINTDPHFKSNVALKEAMGYILGMGFVFKAKPHAFASSSCADKVV
ncbi:MAG: ribonuclease H-like YkuK family protein [Chitinophagales bacterium]